MGTIVAACAVLVLSTIITVGGFLIVDRLIPMETREGHNNVGGLIYCFLGPLYAVLLAFVVFVVWGYFQDARTAAANEATALYAIYGVSKGFGAQDGTEIQQAALTYGQSVVRDEWPLLGDGERSEVTRAALFSLGGTIESFSPANSRESNLQQLSLSELHDLTVARNLRILQGEEALNPILWIGLLVGGAMSIAYSYVFGMEDRIAHSIMVGVLTVAIAGILFMIQAIDRPYHGDVKVEPTAMQEVVAIIQSGR